MKTNKEWMSISDMMAGLMMVFLFIAVVFMQKIHEDKESMVEIARTYEDTKIKLNEALHKEFDDDLEKWGAEILDDNTIVFYEPRILFDRGKAAIKQHFKSILNEFFPRYVDILSNNKFIKDIVELRVEGHTSSEWLPNSTIEEAYLKNAWLSQERAFSVLSYLFSMPEIQDDQSWLISVFRANGMAFAHLIIEGGEENKKKSRRVEFRVVTNTEKKIEKILEKSNGKYSIKE